MGAKNPGFPIDFDRRPYNSVTHYCDVTVGNCKLKFRHALHFGR